MQTDPVHILRRFESMKSERRQLEDVWKECYQYTYPLRGIGFWSESYLTNPQSSVSTARSQQAKLYDTTATHSTRQLASALLSGLTPANSQWFTQEVPGGTREEQAWIEHACNILWRNIHASNYHEVGLEAFIDAVVSGMFCMFIREGVNDPFEFSLWPLSNCYFASSTRGGGIDTVIYRFALTAEQAVNEYGKENCSDAIIKSLEKSPDTLHEFVHAIFPRSAVGGLKLPIASVHIDVKGKRVVKESGFNEMPVVVPRLMALPGMSYSHGMVYEALPTIKTLNKLVECVLGSADMSVAGMWGAVDDGVLNPKTVTVGPRRIITVASKDSLFPLMPGSDFQVAQWMIGDMQKSIRQLLMSDQLQPVDGPTMTATEVHARVGIVRQMLGPNYERMQSEFLRPLVNRCFGLAWRAGIFPEPPKTLLNKRTQLVYLSPLARAQQMEEVQAMERYEASLFQVAQARPEVLDNYNFDAAAQKKLGLMSVPAELSVTPQEVQQTRAARQQAQQQAQQQAMAQQEMQGQW